MAEYARQVKLMDSEIDDLETRLKERKNAFKALTQGEIPDYMEELGIESLTLEDGSKVEMKRAYYGSIKKDNEEACFAWLRENDHGSLIKNIVSVGFGKGEDDISTDTIKRLKDMGLDVSQKTSVHARTLNSFITECMIEGIELDTDLFSVFPFREVKFRGE